MDRIHPLAVEHAIEIECALAPAWTVVSADELGQLITNLLVNAVDFSGPAGVIRVSVRNERGAAVLVVEDTGAGIAAADLPHVFERFYRADRSRSRAGHSGLGLAICKSIVDAAGGMIDVSSRLGVGTTRHGPIPRGRGESTVLSAPRRAAALPGALCSCRVFRAPRARPR